MKTEPKSLRDNIFSNALRREKPTYGTKVKGVGGDQRRSSSGSRLWKAIIWEKSYPCFSLLETPGRFLKDASITRPGVLQMAYDGLKGQG
jgi:hypothetical protein